MKQPAPAVECSWQGPGFGQGRPDMAPYVDERINRTASLGGYTLLGLQWHPKLSYRAEMTGVPVNGYNTEIDEPPHKPVSGFEVDYWFGGLVAGGVAPQPSSVRGSSAPGPYDVQIGAWIRRYRRYGHMSPAGGGIETLRYDGECCHVQGECEWAVCRDVVASQLRGGTLGTPVVGLYAGAPSSAGSAVALPARMTAADNTTLLLFHAHGVASLAVDVAGKANTHLRVVGVSPEPGAAVVLGGGYWQLDRQDVVLTAVLCESGAVVWKRRLFGGPQTGQRRWAGSLNNNVTGAGVGAVAFVFEKVPA